MIRNYLKVAFRYLAKHKGYTFINTLGLAVGIACCILIMLFVKSEWSFDRFHSKADRIHRAWLQEFYEGQTFINTFTPIPLGPVLQANIPEIDASCRVFSFNPLIKQANNTFTDPVNMVDSNFFGVFDFKLIEGNHSNPFPDNNSIIISEKAAAKYFGKASPMGKNLELQLGDDKVLFTVTGITKQVPLESSIQFEMLIPFSNASYFWSEKTRTQAWSNVSLETYVILKEGTNTSIVNAKIPSVMNPLVTKNYKPGDYTVRLQPITDIHLNNELPEGNQPVSNPKYSYILGSIGILVLLIACVNFVTLSIGRSATRALEVGVRKVLGADRRQLIYQYWGEALLLTLFSLVIGLFIVALLIKPFSQLANRELHFPMDAFSIVFCVSLLVIIGLIAGIYPAIILSSYKPIQVLKGRMKVAGGLGLFRRALVIGQFVASIILIIATISISRQLQYLRSKDLGYQKEQVVIIPTNKRSIEGNPLAQRFQTAIATNSQVISSSTSMYSMAEPGWVSLGYKDDKSAFRQFRFNTIDASFIPTMGLKMVAGRAFDKNNPADSNTIIVNEALVKEYGWKDPIGQRLPGKYGEKIIGVVKDFHFESLHTSIKPLMLALKPDSIFNASSDMSFGASPQPRISIRLRAGDLTAQLAYLKSTWKTIAGDQDFEFRFLDEALFAAYQQEERLGNMVRYASVLSIFIACMGLFGLATLIVVRRTKEIGIRKVLGAGTSNIVQLLSKDFVVLVIIASVIAFPVAWWALSKWLQDFTYRIEVSIWVFVIAALLALLVALLTVSFQAVRAAWTNPVKNLRTE